MDEANAKNAKAMFGEEEGTTVYFEFHSEPYEKAPVTSEQAYELQFRLINFLKESGYGFDGTVRLTTWEKERERAKEDV